ncbi:hypothetical protein B0H66DRAFT_394932 [Apodospora peruviana]|uniref:Mitochondrial intermembrane space import and assembly protein 40 n=1 Tax=Apodospora peruviana TaxID=516989 RepID=A0AAE0HT57_9PEZI|nr:hypothetical protein B0H66DRAFT_394932 [Apodospora peruviana]
MYRSALRSSPSAVRALRAQNVVAGSRRFLSTAPAQKKGTWKGTALRWGAAIGAVYWYNTSSIFADELPAQAHPAPPQFSDSELSTVDAIVEEKRRRTLAAAPPPPPSPPPPPQEERTESVEAAAAAVVPTEDEAPPGSPEALEREAQQQGAFDPETGEINWECPCLGGMADGPCGEEFKAAFSCFVYSEAEPKGMDCIEKFQHMQDCFRKYPEVYGSELADDEDEEGTAPASAPEAAEGVLTKDSSVAPPAETPAATPAAKATEAKDAATHHELRQESDEVPKAAFDATSANKGKEQ